VEFFRQPGKLSTPLHQVTDGSTPALITAVGSPVMLTAATPRDSTTTESRRSAGQALPESVSRFLVTAPQPDGVSSPKTREVPSPGTGPDDRLEQPVAQDAVLPDKGTGSGVKPSVAAARDVETGVAQLSSREAESPARMPATTFAGSLREAVEAPRAQQPPGSKAVLVPSTAPGPSEAQHSASGVRAPAAPVVAQNAELFMSELAERIQVQVRQGGNDIRIQLKPANLGHVEIMAQTGAEGVVARIVTESAAVKQYLENNLHVLEQALVDRGLRMDRIDVVAQGYLDARQSSAHPDSQYGGSGHRADVRGREAALAAGTVPGEDALADSTFRAAIGPHSTFHTVA
jgi:hypothetical protein